MLQSIAENIKRFDLCSLLKLLKELGYQEEDIFFQSSANLYSPVSLCEEIIFQDGMPKVTIVLNLGLLNGNSPLPNFFREKMEEGEIDASKLTKYIAFFDHHLIKNLLAVSLPDINQIFFSDWDETKMQYLKLLDLNSTSTLWHLFQTCFPELTIKVEKFPRLYKEKSSSIVLGKARLGDDAFLGRHIVQALPSYKFTLIGDEMLTDKLEPWPAEVKQRLKTVIFHMLQRTSLHIKVNFIIKNNREIAKLSDSSFLGYCRIGKNHHPLSLTLFSGYSRDLSKIAIHHVPKKN
jgi:predicted component of type VI protein secretion system